MNKKYLFIILLAAVALVGFGCNHQPGLSINGHKLTVEIANTPESQTQGLSDRDFLAQDRGMLFVFDKPDTYAFWMKGMRFPLDFIWIKDKKVVQITSDVQPEPNVLDDLLKRYSPQSPVDWVLEVNAGWAAKNQIKVGDSVGLTQ